MSFPSVNRPVRLCRIATVPYFIVFHLKSQAEYLWTWVRAGRSGGIGAPEWAEMRPGAQ